MVREQINICIFSIEWEKSLWFKTVVKIDQNVIYGENENNNTKTHT